jgi:hypothetical protein
MNEVQKPSNSEEMIRFKPANQFVEQYHGVVNFALKLEELSSEKCCKFGTQ